MNSMIIYSGLYISNSKPNESIHNELQGACESAYLRQVNFYRCALFKKFLKAMDGQHNKIPSALPNSGKSTTRKPSCR